MSLRLAVDQAQLAAFCRRHHISRLAFFGSVLREDFGPASDVDVLVDFEPGRTPGLALIRMEDELSALLGERRVDLVTRRFLNRHIRDEVLREAEVLYAAA
jgi:predicted nucleotidyltransferase